MIITKTPFRLSLFGGGTDYAEFFRNYEDGMVVGLSIDKYAYIFLRKLPKFFDFKSRICYYQIETVDDNNAIEHKAVNAILKYMNVDKGIEMFYAADLPARSGIGSSSTFSVGLIQAVKCLNGEYLDKSQLANIALHVEHDILKENVGFQDQIFAAHGGFNVIKFTKYGHIVRPVITTREFVAELESSLLMVFSGKSRNSSEVVSSYINNFDKKIEELKQIKKLANKSLIYLEQKNIQKLGQLLHESWKFKRALSPNITNIVLDEIYNIAITNGAYGGKVMGGGGGGFMVFLVDPTKKERIKASLKDYVCVDVNINWNGSEVVHASL